MNEEKNEGSSAGSERPKTKGKLLDAQINSPLTASPDRKKQLEILLTEEMLQVWDLLANGRSQKQVAKELGVSHSTVSRRINMALAEIRGWSGREAEDWRNQQLLILDKQISGIVDDTDAQPIPMLDKDGNQMFSKADYPLWAVSHEAAAKARNMARKTLVEYLKHQANLLQLVVERKEVYEEKKVAIGVYNFGSEVGMDDL